MDLIELSRREKRQTFLSAVALAVVVFVAAAPVVEAAISRVELAGGSATAKIRDSDGSAIESAGVGPLGRLAREGVRNDRGPAVRSFAGGGGILGAGDCTASTEPAQGPLANVVVINEGEIITGLVITGTGTVRVTADRIGSGQVPLANFTVNAEHPNEYVEFGYGLTAQSPIRFTGIDGTACNYMVLGQGGTGDPPL